MSAAAQLDSKLPDHDLDDDENGDRRPWTDSEDALVLELVHKYGSKKWSLVGSFLEGRSGKQCRERWHNHLNPSIKKDAWSLEEDTTIITAHQKIGSKWSEIAKLLTGRTDNAIKNRWNSTMRRVSRQLKQEEFAKQSPANPKRKKKRSGQNELLFQYCLSLIQANPSVLPTLPQVKKDRNGDKHKRPEGMPQLKNVADRTHLQVAPPPGHPLIGSAIRGQAGIRDIHNLADKESAALETLKSGLASPVIIQSKRFLDDDEKGIIRARGRAPMMAYNDRLDSRQVLGRSPNSSPPPPGGQTVGRVNSGDRLSGHRSMEDTRSTSHSGLTDSSDSNSDEDSGGENGSSQANSAGPSNNGDPISLPGSNPSHLSSLQADEHGRIGRYVLPQLFNFSPGLMPPSGKSLEVKVLSPRSRIVPPSSLQSPVEALHSPIRGFREFLDSIPSPVNTLFSPHAKTRASSRSHTPSSAGWSPFHGRKLAHTPSSASSGARSLDSTRSGGSAVQSSSASPSPGASRVFRPIKPMPGLMFSPSTPRTKDIAIKETTKEVDPPSSTGHLLSTPTKGRPAPRSILASESQDDELTALEKDATTQVWRNPNKRKFDFIVPESRKHKIARAEPTSSFNITVTEPSDTSSSSISCSSDSQTNASVPGMLAPNVPASTTLVSPETPREAVCPNPATPSSYFV